MKKPFVFLLHALVVLNCSTPKKQADNERIHEEVKSTLTQMWDAIEKEDLDRYSNFIHDDFTQFGENDSILQSGKAAELAGVRDWINRYDSIHTEMTDPRIVIEGDIAWITYYWSDRSVKNGEHFSSRGKSTRIFLRKNDQWLCIHGHYTSLP